MSIATDLRTIASTLRRRRAELRGEGYDTEARLLGNAADLLLRAAHHLDRRGVIEDLPSDIGERAQQLSADETPEEPESPPADRRKLNRVMRRRRKR
jgi:hypothetical protein